MGWGWSKRKKKSFFFSYYTVCRLLGDAWIDTWALSHRLAHRTCGRKSFLSQIEGLSFHPHQPTVASEGIDFSSIGHRMLPCFAVVLAGGGDSLLPLEAISDSRSPPVCPSVSPVPPPSLARSLLPALPFRLTPAPILSCGLPT
ncbi:hypothetical protein EX30DRAFT_168117 [Ascodesmis nigricans]|uniref:Uncharacterized protein n=1 Tax=Ascodesmis nigricans TaxID=341454 RepID=A0A4S2MM55_9PEZI|nr:hypothetical protein EX30DRAFT_168117 [Ascodesmis nigricans]